MMVFFLVEDRHEMFIHVLSDTIVMLGHIAALVVIAIVVSTVIPGTIAIATAIVFIVIALVHRRRTIIDDEMVSYRPDNF